MYALLYAFCSQIDESGVSCTDEVLKRFCAAFPVAVLTLLLLGLSMVFLIGDSYNPFLYFRF